MLAFPFYDTLIFILPFFFSVGLWLLFQAVRLWEAIIHERQQPPDTIFSSTAHSQSDNSRLQAGLATVVGVVFVLAGGWGTIHIGSGKYQFRSLPLEQLAAIEVYRADDEYSVDRSRMVRIENIDGKVAEALKLLRRCTVTSHSHETFKDGFVLRLIFDDPSLSEFYLAAFRRSTVSNEKTMVMPQRSPIRGTNLGEYGCPEFQDWLQQNVDPLFAKPYE
jgi:hypothetical protein